MRSRGGEQRERERKRKQYYSRGMNQLFTSLKRKKETSAALHALVYIRASVGAD